MSKSVKRAIGDDLKNYQVFSYPTDNYGLVTSYHVTEADFVCDMWNCLGINIVPVDPKEWLSLNNFAAVGNGGAIELSEKVKMGYAINVVLPKIYNVLGIEGGVNKKKLTNTSITIGKASIRKLRKEPMLSYLNSLSNQSALKEAFNSGNLIITVADCVIDNLSVSIGVDAETAAAIDGKMNATVVGTGEKIFQDASVSLSANKSVNGSYTFTVKHPVVFARLLKRQPAAGELKESDFTDWLNFTPNSDPTLITRKK